MRARAACVLASLLLWGCDATTGKTGSASSHVRQDLFIDLADSRTVLESSLGEAQRGLYFCDDQTGWGITLRPGERLSLELEAEVDATVRVEVCARARERGTRGAAVGELGFEWQAASGSTSERRQVRFKVRRWQYFEQPLFAVDESESAVAPSSLAGAGRLILEGAQSEGFDLHLEVFVEQSKPATVPPAATRVLLVSIDTLREDAISAFGGKYETPNLDLLIAESESFRPHYAGATWTKPSHITLLTGLPTWWHRVRSSEDSLPAAIDTLAERLQAAQVETAGMAFGIPYFDARFGIAQGFDEWHTEQESAGRVFRRAANWVTGHRDSSFFLFVHTYEPHSDFSRLPYEGRGTRQLRVEREFGIPDFGCAGRICASMRLEAINRGIVQSIEGEPAVLDHLYGRGVEETDRQLGVLLDSLKRSGLYQSSTIIITSDHGEALLERGRTLHSKPHEEILRIPLIVKWPHGRNAGRETSTITQSIDIAPTVLELFGLASTSHALADLPGRSLVDLEGPAPVAMAGTWEVAVTDGRYKAVFGEQIRLFDLATDPLELEDIAAQHQEQVARLRSLLVVEREAADSFHRRIDELSRNGTDQRQELTEEERERLRALGYVE